MTIPAGCTAILNDGAQSHDMQAMGLYKQLAAPELPLQLGKSRFARCGPGFSVAHI